MLSQRNLHLITLSSFWGPPQNTIPILPNPPRFYKDSDDILTTGAGFGEQVTLASSSFTSFAGDLLVGNFGDGKINVFNPNPATPGFLGQLNGLGGTPIVIDGLWGLMPGNDGNGGSSQKIYFSAGPNGEANGIFGVLQSVPEPSSMVLELIAAGLLGGGWTWKHRRRRVTAGNLPSGIIPRESHQG